MTAEETAITSPPPAETAPPPAPPEPSQPAPEPTPPAAEVEQFRSEGQRFYENITSRLERMAQGFDALERQRAPAPAPEVDPDPEENPIEALKVIKSRFEARERADQQANAMRDLVYALDEDETACRKEHPDYDEAANFLVKSRREELMAYGVSEAEAVNQTKMEALALTARARQSGQNAGRMAMGIAKARGWKPTPPASAPATQQQPRPAAPSAAAARQRSAAPQAGAPLTLQQMAALSDDAFGRAVSDEQFRKVMRQFYGQGAA